MTTISPKSAVRRWSGTVAYIMFVLVVALSLNQYERQRADARAKFIQRVCVALDDFRSATNKRNAPLYKLVLDAGKGPQVNPQTGKPLTPKEKAEKLKTIKAFGEAYKPIPPVTNCDDNGSH